MNFLQCPSFSISYFSSSPSTANNRVPVKFTVSCSSVASPVTVVNGNVDKSPSERNEVLLGLPSKGRMATDTLELLKVIVFVYLYVLMYDVNFGIYGLVGGRFHVIYYRILDSNSQYHLFDLANLGTYLFGFHLISQLV